MSVFKFKKSFLLKILLFLRIRGWKINKKKKGSVLVFILTKREILSISKSYHLLSFVHVIGFKSTLHGGRGHLASGKQSSLQRKYVFELTMYAPGAIFTQLHFLCKFRMGPKSKSVT